MPSHKERMITGEPYLADDPELLDDRRRCRLLTEQLNATSVADPFGREEILRSLLGHIGDSAEILSPFQCDYGYQISIGARTFINFGAVILDSAPVQIGDDVQIGPSVQIVTPTHPLDPVKRRTLIESGPADRDRRRGVAGHRRDRLPRCDDRRRRGHRRRQRGHLGRARAPSVRRQSVPRRA